MRRITLASLGLIALALASRPTAQGIFREPARGERPVEVVEGARRPPVELSRAVMRIAPFGPDGFAVRALARQPRPGPRWDRLEVRLAFRLDEGVRTYAVSTRAAVNGSPDEWATVELRPAGGTAAPSLLEWSERTPVAMTIERITTGDGTELWANPDARDRLWEELWSTPAEVGRPPRG
jgi:hypothetical protein